MRDALILSPVSYTKLGVLTQLWEAETGGPAVQGSSMVPGQPVLHETMPQTKLKNLYDRGFQSPPTLVLAPYGILPAV